MAELTRRLFAEAVASVPPPLARLRGAAVFVVGGSGFLASTLLAYLAGCDARHGLGLRLFASGRRARDEVALFGFLGLEPAIEWQVADLETTRLPDVPGLRVIHAASYGSPRDYLREPLPTFRANTDGLIGLYEAAARVRGARFVYLSSAEVYGQPPESAMPTPEHHVGGVDTLAPRSIYGESKRMGEVLGVCLARETGVGFTTVRPWNVYGPGQRIEDGRVPIEFLRQARAERLIRLASNGRPRRAFCFAWDAARQIASALAEDGPVAAFNVGNPTEETSMLELARRCAAVAGLASEAVEYDADARAPGLQRCLPDTQRVVALGETEPRFTPLAIGLAATWEWVEYLASIGCPDRP